MDFHLTEEEQKLVERIHEFAVNEVAPLAAELAERERFPSEAFKRLGEMNMMGVCYPKEVGGGGHSYLAYIAMGDRIQRIRTGCGGRIGKILRYHVYHVCRPSLFGRLCALRP